MQVAHEVRGDGPPVLLVCGLAQPGARWRRVAARLAERYTVVTFDNRETGATGPCPEGFLLSDIAADGLELMDGLGHDRFFLGGISMGGMIAQEVVRKSPDRVRAAVLLATHGGSTGAVNADPSILAPSRPVGPTYDDRLAASIELWTRLTGPGFAAAHPEVVEEEARLAVDAATPLDGIMRQMQAIFAYDGGAAAVAESGVPVAVGHGDHDPLVPYENGVRLAAALGVDLVTYEGAGHMLECERVDEVVALMERTFT